MLYVSNKRSNIASAYMDFKLPCLPSNKKAFGIKFKMKNGLV